MVYKKRYNKRRRYNKKRNYKRRKYNKVNKYNTILKAPSGIPEKLYVKLRYYDQFNQTAGAFTNRIHRLNSLYDPDYTGVGSQAYYRDQLSTLYEKYQVYGAKVWINFCNDSTQSVNLAIYASPSYSNPAWFKEAAEFPYSKVALLALDTDKLKFQRYYWVKKIWGKALKDDNFWASYNADPTNGTYLHVCTENSDGTTAIDIHYQIIIKFYCKFFKRIQVGTS